MRALFLGETSMDGPARYLAAVLTHSKIPFAHYPDQSAVPPRVLAKTYDVVILSDYRYSNWTMSAERWLIQAVRSGTGLFMLGGWASFTGLIGGYAGSPIEALLPVRCRPGDDRVNRPAVLRDSKSFLAVVNGYHIAKPRSGSKIVLEFQELGFVKTQLRLKARHPALVTGQAGLGRTAAFLTDCAPHWAGGLIDWGRRRVSVNLGRYGVVEVGDQYLRFFRKWIMWTAGKA